MKKSVKPLPDPVSKKPLSNDVPKILHLQKPPQDDGLFRTKADPSPPAAAPGILLFSLTSVDSRSILIGSFRNLILILSVAFSGQGYLRGAEYQNLSRLGDPLDHLSEPRYWWCAEYLDRWLGFN